MSRRRLKNAIVVLAGLALAALGVYNVVLKATWTPGGRRRLLEAGPAGARRLPARSRRPGRPRRRARGRRPPGRGRRGGPEPGPARGRPRRPAPGQPPDATRCCARTSAAPSTSPSCPCPGATSARSSTCRWPASSASSSAPWCCCAVPPTGRPCTSTRSARCSSCATPPRTPGSSSTADWAFFWADSLAGLFLPVVFLHFCLTFPERRLRAQPAWLVPALYMPALVVAGATATSHALFAAGEQPGALWGIVEALVPGGAALLRRLLHPRLRGPARLLPAHARAHRAPAGEVAAVGHRGGCLPLPGLLRPALRPRPRARARAAARRLRAARASSRSRSPTRWSSTA